MSLLLVGYVLHALACLKDGDTPTSKCVELVDRRAASNLYTCQRSMAVAAERVPAVPSELLGLSGSYHFVFECKPVNSGRV